MTKTSHLRARAKRHRPFWLKWKRQPISQLKSVDVQPQAAVDQHRLSVCFEQMPRYHRSPDWTEELR